MDCNKINQAGWGKGNQSTHESQGDYAGNVSSMGKGKGGYKGKGGFKGYGDKGGKEEANRTMTVKGTQYSMETVSTAGNMDTR